MRLVNLGTEGIARRVRVPQIHVGYDATHHPKPAPEMEVPAGAVCLSLPDVGFAVIRKDDHYDVPSGVSVAAVRAMAPHLVPEDEWRAIREQQAEEQKKNNDKTSGSKSPK